MTPEQEYEQAVEVVAWGLSRLDGVDWERQTTTGHNFWKRKARELLALTWPSGQPMIAVMARDQGFRALTALMPPERKIGFDLAVGEMKEAGFRRVVHPALKQEAK